MRQIVLDTETTGIDPAQGHRVIEIGCVELIDRRLTGNHFHAYIQPERDVPKEVIEIHGITNEFLQGKPVFNAVADDFFRYIEGAELVIHNAPFDMGFLNNEYRLMRSRVAPLENHCSVLDTLYLARQKHPGQRNTLDALCKRYGIDNGHRTLHGALLDAEILADVYLMMTGGQTSLSLVDEQGAAGEHQAATMATTDVSEVVLSVIQPTAEEQAAHQDFLSRVLGLTDEPVSH
ncbi:MAG: DNA polymerase III subunit epsilon [Natronospirillum sp.]